MYSLEVLRVLFFVFVGHFCVDFMIGIWPVFKTMANLDLMLAGFIAGFCALIAEGMQFLFGSLADRGYQRWLVLSGIVLATLSTLFPLVGSYWAFFFLYFGTSIGSSAFHPTASSLLGGLQVANRHSIMGLFTAFGALGMGLSQLCFATTYANFDGATYLIAIPFILLAVSVLIWLPRQPVQQQRKSSFSPKIFIEFMRNRSLRSLWIALMGNQVVAWSFIFLLPDFLKSRGFDSWIVFGGGHLFYMAGAAFLPPVFGYMADKASPSRMITALSLSSMSCFYLFLFAPITSLALQLGLLFCIGGTLASISPLSWGIGAQLVPNARGSVSAFLMGFVWMFSEAFAMGTSGVLATVFTDDAPAKVLSLMGVGTLITIYFSTKLPKQVAETEQIA
jgi:FSR family fosmidomycin resistance protein-like MFS transporter